MGGINDFIKSKISISKYTAKIKIYQHKKLEPVGISLYARSATVPSLFIVAKLKFEMRSNDEIVSLSFQKMSGNASAELMIL